MDVLILGGNSPHNREWVGHIKTTLAPLFQTVATHDYAHWASTGSTIDFEHELRAVQREIRGLGEYVVFAKSAGVLLCLKGMAENIIKPEKVIFLGTPLNFVRQHGLDHELEGWLKKVTEPMLVIQNAHDPVASAGELDRYLKSVVPPSLITFAELPSETHDYVDYPQLHQLTSDFVVS